RPPRCRARRLRLARPRTLLVYDPRRYFLLPAAVPALLLELLYELAVLMFTSLVCASRHHVLPSSQTKHCPRHLQCSQRIDANVRRNGREWLKTGFDFAYPNANGVLPRSDLWRCAGSAAADLEESPYETVCRSGVTSPDRAAY